MNWHRIKGNWKLFKGKLLIAMSRLTGDRADFLAGQREQILGRAQVGYALSREEEMRELQEFLSRTPRRAR